ncbi:GroES-like protein [Polyplosphaeria fusca]|uniref:GroES-like protein n=1 Tax=Polyplosphaeria fusca TaxID=682080 RepID=A0A9P4QV41_9PLEO|nr:GroES-like protein [Polyplosphaeria fusca]
MRALVLDAEERNATLQDISQPLPGDSQILVQVKAISLNPIDPLYVANPLGRTGRTIGSDFAGIVSSVDQAVLARGKLKVGDRVAGFLQGACSRNDRPGAFAEYLVVDVDLVWKIPDKISLEEAAGVSLVALTAAQGIYFRLGLPSPFAYDRAKAMEEHPDRTWNMPGEDGVPDVFNFFVYSASTAVGLFVAQMVRLSARSAGKKVQLFGAASKSRWEMLRAEPYEYDHLVDYRDQDWPEQLKTLSNGIGMQFAYDCISEGDSVERVSSTLAAGGRSVIVRSRAAGAWTAGELPFEPIYGAVWEGLGAEIEYQAFTVKKSPAARAFAVAFYEWLSEGSNLVAAPIRLMPGGLEKVVDDGFKLLGAGTMDARNNKRSEEWMKPVSAEKLVYRV